MQTLHKSAISTDSSGLSLQQLDDPDQLFFIEELSAELIKKFNTEELRPYFKGVYADLLLRSSPAKDQKTVTQVDKVTFTEFINLPGVLSERFFTLTALSGTASKVDARVLPEKFTTALSTVYCSSLEEKMQLVF